MHNVHVVIGLILVIGNLLVDRLDAKIVEGHLTTSEDWAFLARFCFLSEKGKFQYDFTIDNGDAEVNLLLYYDSPNQWPSVYPSNKTCLQRESVLRPDLGQIVSLSPYSIYPEVSGCYFTTTANQTFRCTSYREFRSARPRWWFIAVSDCQSGYGLNITYWVSLTNGEPGSFWREHFSADEFYILPELITGACIYIILIGLSVYVSLELQTQRFLHVTYKLFMISLMTEFGGMLCEIYSYVNRALKGVDIKEASIAGKFLQACSEISFTALLLLMSLGYTVTKSVLTLKQIQRLSIFIGLTIFLQLLLISYESEAFDPGSVLYIYESPPGYLLIALKICAWIIFVVSCYNTGQKAAAKFQFYGSLLSLGSSWFLIQPLMVLTMTYLVDKWVRQSVVMGCTLWVTFVGHVTFLYMTRPARANNNFIRCTQEYIVIDKVVQSYPSC